jgi:anti-anti-sigma regulatory factor
MTTFETRSERNVGMIEVTGSLDDGAINGLRHAFAEAVGKAKSHRVLIIVNDVHSMSDRAALVLAAEVGTLRARHGECAWVSKSGWTPTRGVVGEAPIMNVYKTLNAALDALGTGDGP